MKTIKAGGTLVGAQHGASAGVSAASAATCKLRVLCLHGGYQNGPMFNKRIKDMKKRLKAVAEFETPSGQFVAPNQSDDEIEQRRNWFNWDEEGKLDPDNDPDIFADIIAKPAVPFYNLDKTMVHIDQLWHEHGPFDGILGFSQGSLAASIWMRWRSLGRSFDSDDFAAEADLMDMPIFFISVGGMIVPSPANFRNYLKLSPESPMNNNCPSLHVIGEADTHVKPDNQKRFAHMWGGEIYTHGGTHFVPCKAVDCIRYKEFLMPFFQAKNPTTIFTTVQKTQEEFEAEEKIKQRRKAEKAARRAAKKNALGLGGVDLAGSLSKKSSTEEAD